MVFLLVCIFLFLKPFAAGGTCHLKRTPLSRVARDEFGVVSIKVNPGYKRVLIDHEGVIAFAENVLLTTGLHRVQIVAMPGYADTAFVFEVEKKIKKEFVVHLRELESQKAIRLRKEAKKAKNKKIVKTTFKANMVLFGATSSFIYGYYLKEENLWELAVMSTMALTVVVAF